MCVLNPRRVGRTELADVGGARSDAILTAARKALRAAGLVKFLQSCLAYYILRLCTSVFDVQRAAEK